ncbi:APC family permease [Actinomadura chibensis]|uniref:Amino acid permease n=1 Tax=Actinomadura chibensis TaxID=392828 RepID=A0A5D0NU64_9ACTN|nr:amino acid permease [Actinomadura chibensis]TYB48026.1 amino acid permease [Actinomadura chibensis]
MTTSSNEKAGGAPSAAEHPHTLRKGFDLRSATALAFADVSPIVALYAIFTLGLLAAGPAFWWAFPIVLGGQLLVACVFGELASRWPYEGSVYQWARHVRGPGAGWFAAWAYMWGLTIALSTLSYGAAGFLLQAVGVDSPGKAATMGTALAILALGSLANIVGRRTLKILVVASLVCEVLASVGLGTVLLLFYREHSFGFLLDGAGTAGSGGWLAGPMLAAAAFVGWSFVGFESAGAIAEEVEHPEREVPKALIFALLAVGIIVMYSAAGLILAIPDLPKVMGGGVADPVSDTLVYHFGSSIGRPLLVMFVIGFLASFLAVQAAVSRVIWASARDKALPGSGVLGRLAGPERLPVPAILLTAVGAAVFVLLSGSKLYSVLVNFTTVGFYVAFGLPVWGAALQHLRGRWRPGSFSLGRFSGPVTYAAAVWLAVQTVNIVWPRDTGDAWYIEWSMVITLAAVGAAGAALYLGWSRHRISPAFGETLRDT